MTCRAARKHTRDRIDYIHRPKAFRPYREPIYVRLWVVIVTAIVCAACAYGLIAFGMSLIAACGNVTGWIGGGA